MRETWYIFIIICIFGLNSCSNKVRTESQNSVIIDSVLESNINGDFLKLFKDTCFKDLHVYTLIQKLRGEKFIGKLIDSLYYPVFGKYLIEFVHRDVDDKPILWNYRGDFYACYKFKINDKYTGLLIREPNQYCELAIELWLYQNDSAKLVRAVELADSYGDENVYFYKDGWIKIYGDKIDLVTRLKCHEVIFKGETPIRDSVFVDNFQFYRFKNDCFTEVDTFFISVNDFQMFNE
jgi:hypothetical protein